VARSPAYAKINLGLVVGRARADGKHEIATVLERVDLYDVIELEHVEQEGPVVEGFAEDTLVFRALQLFAETTSSPASWRVGIEKSIPVGSGLGGGSSDAATALRLANELSGEPLSAGALHELAAAIGSDVPFFLTPGAKLASGDGTELEPVELPREYLVVLALANDARKPSTRAVYESHHASSAAEFEGRREVLVQTLRAIDAPLGLARLPLNELVAAPDVLASALEAAGAFRVDTSGAGPTVYGLFEHEHDARNAERALRRDAHTWVTRPVPGP
jgi:4-diphosphocytidyl-2-C-methyl-D-erythritol kinase